jgi:8-oxo-dGTP pyrophosphatase MutT (NUDIX family)
MNSITQYMITAMHAGYLRQDREEITNAAYQDEDTEMSNTDRRNMDGHFVASAVVLNPARDRALVIHHNFLKKILFPGGHIDQGEDPMISAFREVFEETGYHARPLAAFPINIDSHDIPANPAKNEGAHRHHDLLFLGEANDAQKPVAQEEEVTGVQWVTFDQLLGLGDPRMVTVIASIRKYLHLSSM